MASSPVIEALEEWTKAYEQKWSKNVLGWAEEGSSSHIQNQTGAARFKKKLCKKSTQLHSLNAAYGYSS